MRQGASRPRFLVSAVTNWCIGSKNTQIVQVHLSNSNSTKACVGNQEMLPKPREWKRWGALSKTTYVAQLIAPVSLIVGSIFSYLTWKEARQSSELQARLFSVQNPPMVNLLSIRPLPLDNGTPALMITWKNEGDSSALSMCVEILNFDLKNVGGTCKNTGSFRPFSLEKGETFSYSFIMNNDLIKKIGFIPIEARGIDLSKNFENCKSNQAASIVVSARFSDATGVQRQTIQQILLCGSGHIYGK